MVLKKGKLTTPLPLFHQGKRIDPQRRDQSARFKGKTNGPFSGYEGFKGN